MILKKKKFILATYGDAGFLILAKFFEYNVSLKNIIIFTHNNKANKRFINFLKMYKLKYIFDNQKLGYIKKKFLSFKPNFLFSCYFRKKIKQELLNLKGCYSVNMHPSLLPRYAGCFSSCWNILNKEGYTGISFHYLEEKFDTGNIIMQKRVKILKNDTAFSLHYKLINLACQNLYNLFEYLYLKSPKGRKQNIKKRTYYFRILPYSGKIKKNWSTSKKKIFNRAMYFPPFDFREI